jgi:hypothetical protein
VGLAGPSIRRCRGARRNAALSIVEMDGSSRAATSAERNRRDLQPELVAGRKPNRLFRDEVRRSNLFVYTVADGA